MRIAAILIGISWLIFLAYWAVSARNVKRSADPRAVTKRWLVAVVALVGVAMIVRNLASGKEMAWPRDTLWPFSEVRAALAVAVSYIGLAIAIWARRTLGRNWSGQPELKQGHELVISGPYTWVRHPIYSGLLVMFLAVPLFWPTTATLALLPVVAVGIQLKLTREEALMAGEFPEAWPPYRARTSRVIPLIW
ncbi:MAG TPA: isoprenylcysteine carboxylmethyltransferase family protein [Croceibacterium sp.]|jgi:protein-S-isoprenylcysteine O-methyltransferase Ste14